MKILIFSGSHSRHLYIHEEVINSGAECSVVIMEREGLLPFAPKEITKQDSVNFNRHFNERYTVEKKTFNELIPEEIFLGCSIHYCNPNSLNSQETINFVKNANADLAFIFGVDIIREPLLSVLPEDKVNLHLGLSPWYRGSATLFWPFYFLQPQYAGVTFHKIVLEADAGGILHQSVPELQRGDGVHDVGVKAVIQARKDLKQLLSIYRKTRRWIYSNQKSSGKLFLSKDFHPEHLRLIYNYFDNDIVDRYLDGTSCSDIPKLIVHPDVNVKQG